MKKYLLTDSEIRELIDVCYNNSKSDTLKWFNENHKEDSLDDMCKKYPNDFDLGKEVRKHINKKLS
jgi:hypothetical protein